jgi:surface polysaccharide O-acyltransferase-like enzyme
METMTSKTQRIASFDTVKVLAALAVVLLHTDIFYYSGQAYSSRFFKELYFIIQTMCRFAVPYFFVASGYFFGKSVTNGVDIKFLFLKYAKRLLIVYLVWNIFYLPFHKGFMEFILKYGLMEGLERSFQDGIDSLIHHPLLNLLRGTEWHLWFLLTLVATLGMITYAHIYQKTKYLIILAVLLYGFGLLGGAYSHTALGFHPSLNTRFGLFFGTLYIVLGWLLAQYSFSCSKKTALLIFIGGLFLQIFEFYGLRHFLDTINIDYSLSTIVYTLGIFLLAAAYPNFGKSQIIKILTPTILGIFLIHRFFIFLFIPFRSNFKPIIWDLLFPSFVFLLSIVSINLLRSHSMTKQFVE